MSRPTEHYELFVVPSRDFHLTRPDFLQTLRGGFFVVLAVLDEAHNDAEEKQQSGNQPRQWNHEFPQEDGAWLHLGEDDAITLFTGKVEVGQDIRTSLAQIVAEELNVSPEQLRLIMADTDLAPFDRGTFGSRTTPFTVPQLHHLGAATRELLVNLAARHLSVEVGALSVAQGRVWHETTSRSLSFGALAKTQTKASQLASPSSLTSPSKWKTIGRSVSKINAQAMVTGAHRYSSDLTLPGMMWGKVLRPPAIGATLQSLDDRQARALDGVVIVREGQFVGLAAPRLELAEHGLASLQPQWTEPKHSSENGIYDRFKAQKDRDAEPNSLKSPPAMRGDISRGFAEAEHIIEASYRIAYIAHAPLEPRAALAQWQDGRLTVWTGTQRPFGVREELAQALEIPENCVRVIVPDTGSGYGGKHTGEAAIEAARLSRAAGCPVKLVWTREEEFTWAYSRPGGLIEAKVGSRRDGMLTAWEFHNVNSGSAGIATPYAVTHQHIEFHPFESPIRQGSYRALASPANHFARECLMDEIAHTLGIDPLEFRLQNLPHERMRAVLQAAAQQFGWNSSSGNELSPEDGASTRGFGLAVGTEKSGYVATCAEVRVKEGQVKVERLVTAFECGAILNPDNLRNQIEGAVVQGLGGALFEAVEWDESRILSNCFSRYRIPRFSDMPVLETVLLNRPDLPSEGAGESPLIAVAPAIGNAIFAATGVRRRSMPLLTKSEIQ